MPDKSREIALVLFGMLLAEKTIRSRIFGQIEFSVGQADLDLVFDDIRAGRRNKCAQWFSDRGIQVPTSGPVCDGVIDGVVSVLKGNELNQTIKQIRVDRDPATLLPTLRKAIEMIEKT